MKNAAVILITLVLIPFMKACISSDPLLPDPPAGFYAFHTDLKHDGKAHDKYKDLVVVLDKGKWLEFSRNSAYRPLWHTASGTYPVDEFYPDRDLDTHLEYTYVRLIESTPEKIIVHWSYIPDIERINAINESLDPVDIYGFRAAVHELFTIYPDGKLKREMRNASGTRLVDWLDPETVTRQEILLTDKGIEHGEIEWGKKGPGLTSKGIEGNPVIPTGHMDALLGSWTFDEGMEEHKDRVTEHVSETSCSIEGGMTLFKKGVSGTALAFDGYYTGVRIPSGTVLPGNPGSLTAEAWVALDAYPYNEAAVVHRSSEFGQSGFYLGIDPYGYVIFRVDGNEVRSSSRLIYTEWAHIAGIFTPGKLAIAINGKVENAVDIDIEFISLPDTDLLIGRNNEKERCSDYVREFDQNITFLYSIQGLIDEVRLYGDALSGKQLAANHSVFQPADPVSDLALGVLPGEQGVAGSFGATYRSLEFGELWDGLWRTPGNDEVVVKFDNLPTSVIFWKGTNYAANWVTDNNRWFADQSSEIWGPHGCSEHMADKQNRMCYARIIENSPARVVIHWRYPCVDVGYVRESERNWSDEYHTIYPDGTGIRKVYWNGNPNDPPGFQDIQLLTNPGESALDVVNLQALSIANRKGEVQDLTWSPPNHIPENTLEDADIELINTKSQYKVFLAFLGACFTPWGEVEQSSYTGDPFAGPWNHWPMHIVPSDGRFAVDNDRVTHFALAANDCAPEYESLTMYGFTDNKIDAIIPIARSWQTPPEVMDVSGAESQGFSRVYKSFEFELTDGPVSFTINGSEEQQVINPCFVVRHWNNDNIAHVTINGTRVEDGSSMRQGIIRDVDGTQTLVIWTEFESKIPVLVEIN